MVRQERCLVICSSISRCAVVVLWFVRRCSWKNMFIYFFEAILSLRCSWHRYRSHLENSVANAEKTTPGHLQLPNKNGISLAFFFVCFVFPCILLCIWWCHWVQCDHLVNLKFWLNSISLMVDPMHFHFQWFVWFGSISLDAQISNALTNQNVKQKETCEVLVFLWSFVRLMAWTIIFSLCLPPLQSLVNGQYRKFTSFQIIYQKPKNTSTFLPFGRWFLFLLV